jgi:hypothetical protein
MNKKTEEGNDTLENDYPLIPMSRIDDEAREIAVRWGGKSGMDWIGDKHKLASDIMNYARRTRLRNKEVNETINIDGKEGKITAVAFNNNCCIIYVDFLEPNPHFKIYTLNDLLSRATQ